MLSVQIFIMQALANSTDLGKLAQEVATFLGEQGCEADCVIPVPVPRDQGYMKHHVVASLNGKLSSEQLSRINDKFPGMLAKLTNTSAAQVAIVH